MFRSLRCLLCLGVLVAVVGFTADLSWAQKAKKDETAMSGMDIMKKSREGYQADDLVTTVTLLLTDKSGAQKKIVVLRKWKNYRGEDGLDSKTLFWTDFPPDNRGTGFLIWDYSIEGRADDLWLYLPSLRQSRRMTTRDQDDAFMGSDLTFSDMGQRRLDEDVHKLLGEQVYKDTPCYVVESVPKDKSSLYGKRVSWITKDNLLSLKIDYYDRKGELLKTQDINWQEEGGYHVWEKTVVKNVQSEHSTVFTTSDLSVKNGLRDEEFTERTLKRGMRR